VLRRLSLSTPSVSSGTCTVNADSSVQIIAEECVPIGDLDAAVSSSKPFLVCITCGCIGIVVVRCAGSRLLRSHCIPTAIMSGFGASMPQHDHNRS
jgi:hypothetical protein